MVPLWRHYAPNCIFFNVFIFGNNPALKQSIPSDGRRMPPLKSKVRKHPMGRENEQEKEYGQVHGQMGFVWFEPSVQGVNNNPFNPVFQTL